MSIARVASAWDWGRCQASFTAEEVAKKEAFFNFTKLDPSSSEREGFSIFFKDAASRLFRTYSTYARGIDIVNTAYNFLDLVPKGRDEGGRSQFCGRRHDEYGRRRAQRQRVSSRLKSSELTFFTH
jgi:predicted dithiol-disulfide oxidoreductase (DUF899 family)